MSDPQVKWEKWTNPYGIDSDNIDEFTPEDEVDEFDDEMDLGKILSKSRNYAMITPAGPILLNPSNNMNNFFDYWILHSNFMIDKPAYDKVNYVEGVETLDYFSAYRLRVGIGKLFDGKDIRKKVSNCLIESYKNGN
jgi:hypothetical protein